MTSALQKLSKKDRAFLLTSQRILGNSAPDLMRFLPESRVTALKAAWEGLSDQDVQESWKNLAQPEEESLLYHADSSWVSQSFPGETAAVWAVILQDLPKARIGGVLKDLPKETRRDLKRVKVTQLPAAVIQLILRRAEGRFPRIIRSDLEKDVVIKKLAPLGLRDLEKLLRELGISEMALAFSQINRSATRAILNRLNNADSKELRARIKKASGKKLPEQREAQLHILELDLEKLSPEEMVQEIGFGVFSRAFGKSDRALGEYFVHRFPPKQGYVLRRYLDENAPQNTDARITRTRERILDALTRIQRA